MKVMKNAKLYALMLSSILFTGCENKVEEPHNNGDILIEGNNNERENANISIKEEIKEEVEEEIKEEVKENEKEDKKEELEKSNDVNSENKAEHTNYTSPPISNENSNTSIKDAEVIEDDIIPETNLVFTKSEIPEHIKQNMLGKSMSEDSTVSFDELSYLRISHIDYNGKTQVGEMIVSNKLADEVLDIFKDIYNAKFPIEKMHLIDEYEASDHKSMVDNNSSAFCYRTIAGTNKVSNHGLGVAIDINPFYNPHVLKSKGTVNPPEASKYANRSLNAKGMIKANDAVYKAFTSRGWKWGGHWSNPDYQHFEKRV